MRWVAIGIVVCGMVAWPAAGWGQDRGLEVEGDAEQRAALEELAALVYRHEPCGMAREQAFTPHIVEGILKGGFRFYAAEHRPLLNEGMLPVMLHAALDRKRRWYLVGPLAAMYRLKRAS
jgi:hypothetical protein